jgi:hypothetical protein
LRHYPGICSQTFQSFVGAEGFEIDYIGKHENLLEHLVAALHEAGETFDEAAIRRCPPKNVSDKTRFPANFTPALARKVQASEQEAFRRFGYAARVFF